MTETTIVTDRPEAPETPQQQLSTDRRRPGRVEYPNPELIAMLRSAPYAIDENENEIVTDDLDMSSAARGIKIGLLLAMPLWGAIGLTVWSVVHAFSR